jgi:steroid Delta-isomerase
MDHSSLSSPRHAEPNVARVIQFFEAMSPADLDRLGEVYAEAALFKDPFNDVVGLTAIRRVYAHMFHALAEPRFSIHRAFGGRADCALLWHMDFKLRGQAMRIEGASQLNFDADGRIVRHRDYWDAAEELYAKLPIVGALMRVLRRRFSVTHGEGG